ncbi:hypothetical protein MVEN_01412500 [Mycena venus]|uniref:Uncharacterized protein n=1 Tax=Mycena venus TaxID=2733690 RepID=A0A8H6XYW4_9AGAR|nr:hypothetical protein MVEN_01412500 [Mycena venus]
MPLSLVKTAPPASGSPSSVRRLHSIPSPSPPDPYPPAHPSPPAHPPDNQAKLQTEFRAAMAKTARVTGTGTTHLPAGKSMVDIEHWQACATAAFLTLTAY